MRPSQKMVQRRHQRAQQQESSQPMLQHASVHRFVSWVHLMWPINFWTVWRASCSPSTLASFLTEFSLSLRCVMSFFVLQLHCTGATFPFYCPYTCLQYDVKREWHKELSHPQLLCCA